MYSLSRRIRVNLRDPARGAPKATAGRTPPPFMGDRSAHIDHTAGKTRPPKDSRVRRSPARY